MRLIIVILILVMIQTINPLHNVHAETTVTYENPLVYVGADGNLYMTSLNHNVKTLLFTSDEGEISGINWSPDRTRFVFVVSSYLYLASSGQKPVRLSEVEIDQSISAWSPDGQKLAFFDYVGNVQVISVSSHESQVIAKKVVNGCIGDGPPSEPGSRLLDLETGQSSFRCTQDIFWSKEGIITSYFSMIDAEYISQVIKSDGTILPYNLSDMWLSPDQKWEIESYYKEIKDESSNTYSTLDYYLLQERSSNIKIKVSIAYTHSSTELLWTLDSQSILITTEEDRREVLNSFYADTENVPEAKVRIWEKVFGYAPYNATDSLIKLWYLSLNNLVSTELYSRRGFAIGKIELAPDNSSIVLSFITSSFDAAKAIEDGKPLRTVQQFGISHNELIVIPLTHTNPKPYLLTRGGQPAFGRGLFKAIPVK